MGFLDSMKSRLGFDDGKDSWEDDQGYDDEHPDDSEDYSDESFDDQDSGSGTSVRLVTRDARSYSSSRSSRSGYDAPSSDTSSYSQGQYRTSSQRSQQRPIDVFSEDAPDFLKDRPSSSASAQVTDIQDARRRSTSTSVRPATRTGERSSQSSAYDSYQDYLSTGAADLLPLSVVAPSSYNDAQQIATVFKAGRSVALSLRQTRPELAKRILDFSFGVACALSGRVEKVSDRVFLITHNPTGLTDDERKQLAAQGLM